MVVVVWLRATAAMFARRSAVILVVCEVVEREVFAGVAASAVPSTEREHYRHHAAEQQQEEQQQEEQSHRYVAGLGDDE